MGRVKKTLKERIYAAYFDVSKVAKRDCRTWKEVQDRVYWERLRKIMWNRYGYRD